MLRYKSFKLKIDKAQDDGIIRGYASTFGNVDQGRDVIVRGAFKKTIQENAAIPILDSHRADKQIGINLAAEEDSKGLFVEGQLNMHDPNAKAKFNLIKMIQKAGGKAGLSIGFRVVRDEYDRENDIRYLKEVRLFEYSLVAFPMNEEASITEAKAQQDILNFKIQSLIDEGFTQEQIRSALSFSAADSVDRDPQKVLQSLEDTLQIFRSN